MRVSPVTMTLCAVALMSCSGLPLRGPGPVPTFAETRARSVAAFLEDRETGLSRAQIAQVSRVVITEADRTGFTPGLIAALIHVESSGHNFAISRAGALGLMQLLPDTAREVAERQGLAWQGPQMLFDPALNVRLGVDYLAELYERFGDIELALAAYNWGPSYIALLQQAGGEIPDDYAQRVLRYYADAAREVGLGS
ncbi:MAG TPA: lytic transglycosylase domain-containing protein [Myxococcota bacterium]|nr:lytic transglycosylase domain-containing protein [Myxococcota bacterium]